MSHPEQPVPRPEAVPKSSKKRFKKRIREYFDSEERGHSPVPVSAKEVTKDPVGTAKILLREHDEYPYGRTPLYIIRTAAETGYRPEERNRFNEICGLVAEHRFEDGDRNGAVEALLVIDNPDLSDMILNTWWHSHPREEKAQLIRHQTYTVTESDPE